MASGTWHLRLTTRFRRVGLTRSCRVGLGLFTVLAIAVFGIGAGSVTSAAASTAYSPVDFSSQANFTWVAPQSDPDGARATYFPGGPVGSVTLGGIPFNILSNAAGFQAWNGYVASQGKDGTVSLTIPVNIHGATDVYTLINTYWGASGSYTALVFTGSGGATYTDHLFGGSDIRNWCCGGSINGTSTVNVFTVHRSPINGAQGFLDMQHVVLPPVFATQTLTSIQVVDSGATGVQRTVLDGVTVLSATAAAEAPPLLAKSYAGSARNVTAAESAPVSLSGITQSGGTIAGNFAFHLPLAGAGPFKGAISASTVSFTVTPTASSCPSCSTIVFTGTVSPVVSLTGTWVAKLKSGLTQSGTWQVGSTWNGTRVRTAPTPGSGTVALTGVIESPTGTISGTIDFGGSETVHHVVGPFTASVHGSVFAFTSHLDDITAGSRYYAWTITGTLSNVFGRMSGTWLEVGTSDKGTWQVTRSGATTAVSV